MRTGLLLAASLLLSVPLAAQQSFVTGTVTDAVTGLPLAGVHVIGSAGAGTATDTSGSYRLAPDTGHHTIRFRYIGYETLDLDIHAGAESLRLDAALKPAVTGLNIVVVSAARHEQKIEETTVSVEVLPPAFLADRNTTTMETAVQQIPGMHVTDGQANIRGGSGFSYGAGSRVLILVDGMPVTSGDAGDVKWSFLPVENAAQVEVIKGASSALYGSSALNGVISITTALPADTPETRIAAWHGYYNDPLRRDSTGSRRDSTGKLHKPLKWWVNANPVFTGMNFLHSRKAGRFDLVASGNAHSDQGYREGESEQRVKLGLHTRYRFPGIDGLHAGVNLSTMWVDGSLFLLWLDADSGALRPAGGLDTATTTINFFTGWRNTIDPYITWQRKSGQTHSLRGRYYNLINDSDTKQGSHANIFQGEYQFQRKYGAGLTLTSGLAGSYTKVVSDLYGDHSSSNVAAYAQADRKCGRLSLSAGLRLERFRTDTAATRSDIILPRAFQFNGEGPLVRDSIVVARSSPVKPVLRLGMNYRAFKATYVRASFGGGYRFPSIAEKFVSTQVGGLKIFPNPELRPETGWSAEAGLRQVISVSGWKGYADLAAFWTEYQDMMEFTFGQYFPPDVTNPDFFQFIEYSGFKSLNIGNARVTGLDFSLAFEKDLAASVLRLWAGYTWMNTVNLNADSAYRAGLSDTSSTLLKYRFRHLTRADVQWDCGRWSLGLSMRHNSFMENIDRSFEEPLIGTIASSVLLPGYKEYRDEHSRGVVIFDVRLSYRPASHWKVALIVTNLFNKEYIGRPGDIQAPRTVAGQYSLSF